MRNKSILFTSLMILALILSACGSAGNNQGSNAVGTGVPGDTDLGTPQGIPNTGSTLEATEVVVSTLPATQAMETPTEASASPTAAATATQAVPAATQQLSTPTTDAATSQPGTGSSLIGIPQTGGSGLAGLSDMFDFRVVDTTGDEIGTVQDYVINMCEAHILYIVVDPAETAGVNGDGVILIPYEATLETPNQGEVNAGEGVFVVNWDAADRTGVPTVVVDTLDLENPEWEVEVMNYWKSHFRLALTTGCNVPLNNDGMTNPSGSAQQNVTPTADAAAVTATLPAGNPTPTAQAGNTTGDRQMIYRVALASNLLNASLEDGNGNPLGTLRDVAVTLETGHTRYFVFQLSDAGQAGNRLIALPPAAINIRYEAGSDQPVLVLLVDTAIFQNAPAFDQNNVNDQNWFDYWDQYLPMTMDQLP